MRFRCWDGDYVVFNPLSGRTHILDVLAGQLLRNIIDKPTTTNDLRADVATFLELENDDLVGQTVLSHLRLLEDLGLIEPSDDV